MNELDRGRNDSGYIERIENGQIGATQVAAAVDLNGRSLSSMSTDDFSSTWAIDGGRLRFRFDEYALEAAVDDDEVDVYDDVDIR